MFFCFLSHVLRKKSQHSHLKYFISIFYIRNIAPPIPIEIQKGLDQIYDGIKKNAEINAQRAKSDPEFAKQQQARAQADYYGHYVPSK